MTATSLRKTPPFRNMLRTVRQNLKMTVVTCVLQLLGIPLIVGDILWQVCLYSHLGVDSSYYMSPGLYAVIGMFCLSAAVFLGMIAGINSFTETHSKSRVDMLYALPLTGKQRFFSDYLGGLCIYVLPYLVSVVLGWGIIFLFGGLTNWSAANMLKEDITWDNFMTPMIRYYAYLTIGLLVLMLLYYTLSVLVTCCCGTLFESIYTNILLNLLVPGCLAAVIGVLTVDMNFYFAYTWDIIGYTSPIGGLIYLILLVTMDADTLYSDYFSDDILHASQAISHATLPNFLRWGLVILVLTVVLLLAAWQLYTRRKAEQVGKPFVWLGAYYVMLTLITVSILCLLKGGVIGPVLLFAAIVYFVMEVIRKRGFKRFWLTVVSFAATVAITVGLYALTAATGGFGRETYVPAVASVSSVEVGFSATRRSDMTLEFTDKDIIRQVADFHKALLSARKGKQDPGNAMNEAMKADNWRVLTYSYVDYVTSLYDYMTEDPNTQYRYYDEYGNETETPEIHESTYDYADEVKVAFTYYTITGSRIHREYDITADEWQALREIMTGTDLCKQAYTDAMRALIQRNSYSGSNTTGKWSIDLAFTVFESSNYNDSTQEQTIMTTDVDSIAARFAEAYQHDIADMTAEDFRTAQKKGYLQNNRSYGIMIPIYECCTETWELLESYGFRAFTAEERSGLTYDPYSNYDYYTDQDSYLRIRIYAPGTYRAASDQYPCSSLTDLYVKDDTDSIPAYEDSYVAVSGSMKANYPELEALLQAVQQSYVSEEDCYAVFVNGRSYLLPADQSELAEAVIAKGDRFWEENWGKETDWSDYLDQYGAPDYPDPGNEDYLDDDYIFGYDYYEDNEPGTVVPDYPVPDDEDYYEDYKGYAPGTVVFGQNT